MVYYYFVLKNINTNHDHLLEYFTVFRSPTFHNFVKISLTKNPKKRPTAEKLLMVSMVIFVN